MTPFDITPTTAAQDATVTLTEGETCTITLYRAGGAGPLPGQDAKIVHNIGGGIEQVSDVLLSTQVTRVLDAKGVWIIRKPASDVAYGVKGV